MFQEKVYAKTTEAQKRANKTGVTHYVGLTFTNKLYIAKKRPTQEWLVSVSEPQS